MQNIKINWFSLRFQTVAKLGFFALFISAVWMLGSCKKSFPQFIGPSIQASWSESRSWKDRLEPLDLLLVLDSSPEMEVAKPALHDFLRRLEQWVKPFGMTYMTSQLSFTVMSGDLGAGKHTSIEGCTREGGDRGELGILSGVDVAEMCIGNGQRYLVDRPPLGCTRQSFEGELVNNPCAQENCDMVSLPGENLFLAVNRNGLETCRNFSGDMIDVLECLVDVPFEGCRFFQPLNALESMLKNELENFDEHHDSGGFNKTGGGFFRKEGVRVVMIVAGKDDCSAADPDQLYDPSVEMDDLNSWLGPFGEFRCFEWGVDCGVSDPRAPGVRTGCTAGPGEGSSPQLMRTVESYLSTMKFLNPSFQLSLFSFGGRVSEELMVSRTSDGNPRLEPSCRLTEGGEEVFPAVRLREFVMSVMEETLSEFVFHEICRQNFSGLFGHRHPRSFLDDSWLRFRISGCPEGVPGTSCQVCNPNCAVWVTIGKSLPDERIYRVPWCGHVCRNGMCTPDDLIGCLEETDGETPCACPEGYSPTVVESKVGCALLHYPMGVPYEYVDFDLDPRLADILPSSEPMCIGPGCPLETAGEASACWYLVSPSSERYLKGGDIGMVMEKQRFPSRIFYKFTCRWVPDKETLCDDGIDNDEDCLTDEEDPDCFPPEED